MLKYRKAPHNLSNSRRWYNKDRQLHRKDGPAVEDDDGYKAWYINGTMLDVEYPGKPREKFIYDTNYV